LLKELCKKQVEVDVFIPECMNYFAENEIANSLIKTKKLFIWDSGHTLNGHFADLINNIQKNLDFDFDYQVVPMNSIPASDLENNMLYNVKDVINKLRELYEK
jgi:pyruvate/2-oxoglutarate/acetoin dehydrogenase E1 component